jgi:hypothetical protein
MLPLGHYSNCVQLCTFVKDVLLQMIEKLLISRLRSSYLSSFPLFLSQIYILHDFPQYSVLIPFICGPYHDFTHFPL